MTGYRVAYLPGDGIGPEVCAVARRCADALGERFGFDILGWRGNGFFIRGIGHRRFNERRLCLLLRCWLDAGDDCLNEAIGNRRCTACDFKCFAEFHKLRPGAFPECMGRIECSKTKHFLERILLTLS
jgi:hypothetical protein